MISTALELTHEDAVLLVDAIRVANSGAGSNLQQMELGARIAEHYGVDDPFFQADYEAVVAHVERFKRPFDNELAYRAPPLPQSAWEAVALRNLDICLEGE